MIEFAVKILTAQPQKTSIFFVGQAGFIFKSKKGTLIGVDLYLSHNVERTEDSMDFKRLTPTILSPGEVRFDYLVATHPHFDHFDIDSMPMLTSHPNTHLFASDGCKEEIERLRMREAQVTYVRSGDVVEADDIKMDYVPCDHGSSAPDAVGIVITIDGKKVYIAGDTCFRRDYGEEISAKGPFDLMIAPINGAYGNLNEAECVKLAGIIKPGMVIPCHFGTFAGHGGDAGVFSRLIRMELPDQKFLLMAQGEELIL